MNRKEKIKREKVTYKESRVCKVKKYIKQKLF